MKIQAITPAANNYQMSSKAPTFGALWMRLGQNYLDATRYHSAVFYPLKNGIQKPVQKSYKGSPVLQFAPIDLTVEESKDAFLFLSKKKLDEAGYNATKKLKAFVESITTKEHKHNVLFIEENDVADVSKARKEVKLADIVAKLSDYEAKKNPVKEPKKSKSTQEKILTDKELQKFLTENGVA